jgi:hypothetical protein
VVSGIQVVFWSDGKSGSQFWIQLAGVQAT